jgi:glucose/arabinose dehydrogenase
MKAEVVTKLDGIVWGMDWLEDGVLVVTQKSGSFWRIAVSGPKASAQVRSKGKADHGATTTQVTKIGQLPSSLAWVESGQGGLLDVMVLGGTTENKGRRVLFTYSKRGSQGLTTALGQADFDPVSGVLQNFRDLYVANAWGSGSIHFGSRLAVGTGDELFMTVGDRGERDRAPEKTSDAGKVLRLRLDGSVPSDNPFSLVIKGNKKSNSSGQAVFSLGHRNPQGIFFDPKTNRLFVSEHGPRGGDEINEVRRGGHYGWPIVTHGREYSGPAIGKGTQQAGMEPPLKVYVPSIAPSSLLIYQSSAVPSLRGSFVLGALVLQHLNVVSADAKTEQRYMTKFRQRIRDVIEDPQGALFLATDSGLILKLSP